MTECENRSGCGCSRCVAPSVSTALISGDPWEALFVYGDDNPDGFSGSGSAGDEPFVFHFTVYPGDDLPYYRVSFDGGDYEWDPDAVTITDEDGNIVTSDMVFDEPHEFTMTVDSSAMPDTGQYIGGLNVQRGSTAEGPWDEENTQTKSVDVALSARPDACVNHVRHDLLHVYVEDYSTNPINVMFPIARIGDLVHLVGGLPQPLPVTWSIQITPADWPVGSSYTIHNNDVTLVEGTAYGPIYSNGYFWLRLAITHTGMAAGQVYNAQIAINTIAPVAKTDVRDMVVHYHEEASPTTHEFRITNPGTVSRGTPFDLEVQAINKATGLADPNYQGKLLRLNLSSMYSPSDSIDPLEWDSEGHWAYGSVTIPGISFSGGAGGWPFLQVSEPSTGNYGVIQLNGTGDMAFELSIAPNLTRGSNYDLTIQAITNDGNDTSYVPASTITLELTSSDAADVLNPLSVDATDWSNGKKVVTVDVSGGTGADSFTIRAIDDTSLAEGEISGAIAASSVVRAYAACMSYYGIGVGGEYPPNETDDWEASAPALWDNSGVDAMADFENDGSLGSADYSAAVQYYDRYEYIVSTCKIYGGYLKITFNAGDKALSIKSAKLRIRAKAVEYGAVSSSGGIVNPLGGAGCSYSRHAHQRELRIYFSESAASFSNGSALMGMTPALTIDFNAINNLNTAQGGGPTVTTTDIYIDVPAAVINGMTGNDLYVWMCVVPLSAYEYISGFNRSTLPAPNSRGGGWAEGVAKTNAAMILYYV